MPSSDTALLPRDQFLSDPRLAVATVRVLHVINGEHYSGPERVQDVLALHLNQLGFEVGFACLKSGRFDQVRFAKQAPLANLDMRSQFDLSAAKRLARLVKSEGYAL